MTLLSLPLYYKILTSAHSGIRYLVLLGVFTVLVVSLLGLLQKRHWSPAIGKLSLATFSAVHIQLTLGLILYFISPRVHLADGYAFATAETRYWTEST